MSGPCLNPWDPGGTTLAASAAGADLPGTCEGRRGYHCLRAVRHTLNVQLRTGTDKGNPTV